MDLLKPSECFLNNIRRADGISVPPQMAEWSPYNSKFQLPSIACLFLSYLLPCLLLHRCVCASATGSNLQAYGCEYGPRAIQSSRRPTLQILQPTGTLLQSLDDGALWAPLVLDSQPNDHCRASSPAKGRSSTVRTGSKLSHCLPSQQPSSYPEAHRACWLAIGRYGEVLWRVSSPNPLAYPS